MSWWILSERTELVPGIGYYGITLYTKVLGNDRKASYVVVELILGNGYFSNFHISYVFGNVHNTATE